MRRLQGSAMALQQKYKNSKHLNHGVINKIKKNKNFIVENLMRLCQKMG